MIDNSFYIKEFRGCVSIRDAFYNNTKRYNHLIYYEFNDFMSSEKFTIECPSKLLLDEKYSKNVSYNAIVLRKRLNDAVINKYKDHIRWDYLSTVYKFTPRMVKKYKKYIDFNLLSNNRYLTYEIACIPGVKQLLSPHLFDLRRLDERMAEMFIDQIDLFRYITLNKDLSHSFMHKYVINSRWESKV